MTPNQVKSPAYTIADEVARREGVAIDELEPPLGSVIDTDALNALILNSTRDEPSPDGFVRFSYYGYVLTVWFDGTVRVDA